MSVLPAMLAIQQLNSSRRLRENERAVPESRPPPQPHRPDPEMERLREIEDLAKQMFDGVVGARELLERKVRR